MSLTVVSPVRNITGLRRQLSNLRPLETNHRKTNGELLPFIELRKGGLVTLPYFRQSQLANIDEKSDPNEARKHIRLEGINERKNRELKISLAKILAGEIKKETKRLQELDLKHLCVKYKTLQRDAAQLRIQARKTQSEKKKEGFLLEAVNLEATAMIKRKQAPLLAMENAKTSDKEFCQLVRYVAAKRNLGKYIDEEVIALTAYYATQRLNGEPFLCSMPSGFFDRDLPADKNQNPQNEKFQRRVAILGRHYFVDISEIKSARAVEDNENWETGLDDGLNSAGLGILGRVCTPKELITLSFPKMVTGENPPIRDWHLYSLGKYQGEAGKELAGKASEWLLRYGEGLVNEDKKSFNMEKVRKIKHWGKIFEKHKMRKMLELSKDHTPNMVEALKHGSGRLKAKGIVKKDLIGFDKDQIEPWEITRNGMWREKDQNGRMLIDDINDYLDEKVLRTKYPQMFEDDGKGKPIAKMVKTFSKWSGTNWSCVYSDVATDCLRNSYMRPHEALERRYPELFGVGENQIKPGEMRYVNMREGISRNQLLREQLLLSFCSEGLPGLVAYASPPTIRFTRSEFRDWYTRTFANGDYTWTDHLRKYNLFGAIKYSDAKGNIGNALKIVFERRLSGPPSVKRLTFENAPSFMKGRSFSMTFTASRERLIEREGERLVWRWLDLERSEFQNQAIEFVNENKSPCKLEDVKSNKLFIDHPVVSVFQSMNEAFFANTQSKNEQEQYFLEKILSAKKTVKPGKTEFVVNEGEIRELLGVIKDIVMDEIKIPAKTRNLVKQYIEALLVQNSDPRNVLLQAANISKRHKGANYFGALNYIGNFLFSVYVKREIEKGVTCSGESFLLQGLLKHSVARATVLNPDPRFTIPVSNGLRAEVVIPDIDQEKVKKGMLLARRIKSEAEYFKKYESATEEELRKMVTRIEDVVLLLESGDRNDANSDSLRLSADIIRKLISIKQGKRNIIRLNEEEITYEKFHEILKQIDGEYADDVEIETVALLYCLKSQANPNGFMPEVPDGMFNTDDDNFLKRVQALVRFSLVNIQKKNTPLKLESFSSIKTLLAFSGLIELANSFSDVELLQMTFPGIFNGINPVVRPWIVNRDLQNGFACDLRKWGHASLLVEEGVLSQDGSVDIGKLGRINWRDAYNRSGMRNVLKANPEKLTLIDIVREGLEVVKRSGVVVV